MASSGETFTAYEISGESRQRPGGRGPGASFGLRAAVLAGLVVATTVAGDAVQGISDDPVRMVAGTGTTCCPPGGLL
jgi:hypothetical protein